MVAHSVIVTSSKNNIFYKRVSDEMHLSARGEKVKLLYYPYSKEHISWHPRWGVSVELLFTAIATFSFHDDVYPTVTFFQ